MTPRVQNVLRDYYDDFIRNPRTLVIGDVADVSGVRKDGMEFPMEIVLGPIETPEGLVITATARNVTERREFERRLEHQATHDHLTGLPNRALFVEQLAESPEPGPAPGAAHRGVLPRRRPLQVRQRQPGPHHRRRARGRGRPPHRVDGPRRRPGGAFRR